MNLKNYLQSPLQRSLSKSALITLFVLTAIGFADATYLTVEHYINKIPPCSIGSCEEVLTSAYSTVAGVPVSLLGSVYYFIVLVLLMAYLDAKKVEALNLASLIMLLGGIISAVFIILQAFVLHAFCIYCMVSDTLSIVLFIVAFYIMRHHRKPTQNEL